MAAGSGARVLILSIRKSELILQNFTFAQPFSDIASACRRNTRLSCSAAGVEYRELAGKLRELARACVFRGPRRSQLRLADRSIAELPTSTAKPRDKVVRDRCNARMAVVAC